MLITGRLEAPHGTPSGVVAGASVEVLPARLDYEGARRQLAGQAPGPPLAATRAAAGGAFRLQVPGPGCFRVVVRAAGFLPLEVPLVPLVEDRELPPARLTPAVPLVARTVGPRGEPIAGVVLSLQSQEREQAPGRSREQGWAPVRRTGRTGPDGTLALPGSPGEKAWLAAIDPRFLGAGLAVDEPPAKAGASGKTGAGGITLRLPHRPALTLEACTPGGEPVAGALLRSSSGWPLAIAGGDGRLEVAVAGQAAGHSAGHPTPLGLTLESPDGEMTAEVSWARARGGVLRVALAPRREAAGQLVETSGGQAVAGGVVWAECGDRFSGPPTAVATVSASALAGAVVGLANAEGQLVLPRRSSLSDGSFVFGGVEPGRYHLAASARGYVGSAYPGGFEVAAAPLERLELVLQRAAGAIRGRLGGDAADPAQVRVGALWLGAGGPQCRQQPQAPDEIPGLLDGSGSYRISDLGPGTWDVFAVAASGRNASGRVDLAPGVSEAVLDLDLSSGFTLSGRVGDDRGPVAGARLGLLGPSLAAGKREVEAASGGSFQFSNLTPGSYGLIVLDPRFFRGAVLSFDLSSDREMAVDLTGGGLRGRVTSAATGEPVARRRGDAAPDGNEHAFVSPRAGDHRSRRRFRDRVAPARSLSGGGERAGAGAGRGRGDGAGRAPHDRRGRARARAARGANAALIAAAGDVFAGARPHEVTPQAEHVGLPPPRDPQRGDVDVVDESAGSATDQETTSSFDRVKFRPLKLRRYAEPRRERILMPAARARR
jgi:hypothetical protein